MSDENKMPSVLADVDAAMKALGIKIADRGLQPIAAIVVVGETADPSNATVDIWATKKVPIEAAVQVIEVGVASFKQSAARLRGPTGEAN